MNEERYFPHNGNLCPMGNVFRQTEALARITLNSVFADLLLSGFNQE